MKTPAVPLTTRGILVLVAALIGLSTLLFSATNHVDDSSHLSLKRSHKFRDYPVHHSLEKRDECEDQDEGSCEVCGPPFVFTTAGSVAARGEYYTQAQAHNVSALFLAGRTIPEQADMDTFMVEEIPKATQMVWQVPDGVEDVNTARFICFDNKNAVSFGTSHLCGCTSLVIISRRGVYATHYWENISFDPDRAFRQTETESNDQIFERTVTVPLQRGKNLRTLVEQQKLDPSKIGNWESDEPRAFLIRPNKSARNPMMAEYERKWGLIRNTVGSIIPLLDPNKEAGKSKWQIVEYRRLSKKNRNLDSKANERILVKYDPKHDGKKKVVLWGEKEKIYEHVWE